jgi:hypothetical protein
VVWKVSRRATPDRKVAAQNPTKPHQFTPWKTPYFLQWSLGVERELGPRGGLRVD